MARLLNDIPRWLLILVWIAGNVAMFVYKYLKFKNGKEYYYLHIMLGESLLWARGSAACLNLNCMLILLPVCRNLLSFIRGCMKTCCKCKKTVRRQLDKNITFHQYIAYAICLHTDMDVGAHAFNLERFLQAYSAVHVGAHVFNLERFLQAYSSPDDENKQLLSVLSHLPTTPDGSYINPIRTSSTDPNREMFKTVAGVSGVIITLCLILIVSSSTEIIRRSYFEVFWFTHHLFVLFFVGVAIHGMQGIVRAQTNLDEHDPETCRDKFAEWGKDGHECAIPQFAGSAPETWQWVIGPVVLYFLERVLRFIRSQQQVYITKVVKHPSNVFELQMKKQGFTMSPGEYIFLHCSSVSRLEWHPFTLTSAPEDDYFSVHVRRVGDWTNDLAKACHVDEEEFKEAWKLPKVAVDGPFGTATEDIFSYEVDIFIAAGIGVTPFASTLKHIWYQKSLGKNVNTGRRREGTHYHFPGIRGIFHGYIPGEVVHKDKVERYKHKNSTELKLKKVYFYWICPDTNSFEWLHDLLKTYDAETQEAGSANFLSYFIYLTRGWDKNLAKNIVLHEEEEFDPITGLQQKTHYGRPHWDKTFPAIADQHKGTKIGVFFCGPKELSSVLHKQCNQHSRPERDGTKFYYNKENF